MYCSFVRQLSVLYNIGLTICAPYCVLSTVQANTAPHCSGTQSACVCEGKALQLTHSLTIDLCFTAHGSFWFCLYEIVAHCMYPVFCSVQVC